MCLYPRQIKNKKYTITKKNGGIVPAVPDSRVLYVPIDCGNCMECRKAKTREWQARLGEDIKTNTGGKFITLTFSNESIKELYTAILQQGPHMWDIKGYELDNTIATLAMRRFNERYRKKYGKAIRHWTVTELGHEGTNNIHLHGIVWPECDLDELEKIWKYGWTWKYKIHRGVKINYVNGRTVNYIVKYIGKQDEMYKHYKSIILTSPGIGKDYINTIAAQDNKFKIINTNQAYQTATGHKLTLPKYWRKKIYSDDEREELWLQSLDKKQVYVCGEKIDVTNGYNTVFKTRDYYRKKNRRLGYGSYLKNEDRMQWEENRRADMFRKRIIDAELKAPMRRASIAIGPD